jgi:hypothetical protein
MCTFPKFGLALCRDYEPHVGWILLASWADPAGLNQSANVGYGNMDGVTLEAIDGS